MHCISFPFSLKHFKTSGMFWFELFFILCKCLGLPINLSMIEFWFNHFLLFESSKKFLMLFLLHRTLSIIGNGPCKWIPVQYSVNTIYITWCCCWNSCSHCLGASHWQRVTLCILHPGCHSCISLGYWGANTLKVLTGAATMMPRSPFIMTSNS